MSSSIEEILRRDGVFVYKTRGGSMKPMLRQNRDLVTIQVPHSRLKKYDVALYKCGEAYVLHRVIKVEPGRYLIRGDNTFVLEKVPESAVIGVLTCFLRNGKERLVTDRDYLFYVRFWQMIYPLRLLYHRSYRGLAGIARRIGLLQLIKRAPGKGSRS